MTDRQSIFITGAASGVGLATARLFHAKGWFVGGFDVDPVRLAALEAELGPEAGIFQRLDVTDREAFKDAFEAFGARTGGRLDILFNNAGIARGGPYDQMPFSEVLAVVNVNLTGVLIGIHAGAGLLKATPNSLCFNMSSASAIFGLPNMAVYAATKAAVKALSEALSVEFMAHGVRVCDAIPGLVDTPFIPRQAVASADKDGMFRIISADDVAKAVWNAYAADQVHWPLPLEISGLMAMAGLDPEGTRAQVAARSGPFSWLSRL